MSVVNVFGLGRFLMKNTFIRIAIWSLWTPKLVIFASLINWIECVVHWFIWYCLFDESKPRQVYLNLCLKYVSGVLKLKDFSKLIASYSFFIRDVRTIWSNSLIFNVWTNTCVHILAWHHFARRRYITVYRS